MRITRGQLTKIIREEAMRLRHGRLHEARRTSSGGLIYVEDQQEFVDTDQTFEAADLEELNITPMTMPVAQSYGMRLRYGVAYGDLVALGPSGRQVAVWNPDDDSWERD